MRTIGKFKRFVKSVILLLTLCFIFTGCRPVLQERYVDSTEADKNMTLYMSEVEKLMAEKGYSKTDRGKDLYEYFYYGERFDIYELNDNVLLVFRMSYYEGKEAFDLAIHTSTEEKLNKSALYLPLVANVLDVVSGYNISEERLNEFCDGLRFKFSIMGKRLDYYGYYELSYIVSESTDDSAFGFSGRYGVSFSVSGLTKTGLETQGD